MYNVKFNAARYMYIHVGNTPHLVTYSTFVMVHVHVHVHNMVCGYVSTYMYMYMYM